jgi:hypothetical protein
MRVQIGQILRRSSVHLIKKICQLKAASNKAGLFIENGDQSVRKHGRRPALITECQFCRILGFVVIVADDTRKNVFQIGATGA